MPDPDLLGFCYRSDIPKRNSSLPESSFDTGQGVIDHLDDSTEFFIEQKRYRPLTFRYFDIKPASRRKSHLQQTGNQAAIRSIVVSQNIFPVQLHELEKLLDDTGIFNIRDFSPGLVVALGKNAAPETSLAARQVDEQQPGIFKRIQLRGQGLPDINDRSKGRDDQRQWRGHGPVSTLVFPSSLHGHGILADGNRYAKLRTQLHSDSLYSIEQPGVLSLDTRCSHPVCREPDILQPADVGRDNIRQRFSHGHPG